MSADIDPRWRSVGRHARIALDALPSTGPAGCGALASVFADELVRVEHLTGPTHAALAAAAGQPNVEDWVASAAQELDELSDAAEPSCEQLCSILQILATAWGPSLG